MTSFQSDALVFFGATGDLAYKKIFPSLQAMVKRGHLNVWGPKEVDRVAPTGGWSNPGEKKAFAVTSEAA